MILESEMAKVLYAALQLQKEKDKITQTKIAKAVNLREHKVFRILQKLVDFGDVTRKSKGGYHISDSITITETVTARARAS